MFFLLFHMFVVIVMVGVFSVASEISVRRQTVITMGSGSVVMVVMVIVMMVVMVPVMMVMMVMMVVVIMDIMMVPVGLRLTVVSEVSI